MRSLLKESVFPSVLFSLCAALDMLVRYSVTFKVMINGWALNLFLISGYSQSFSYCLHGLPNHNFNLYPTTTNNIYSNHVTVCFIIHEWDSIFKITMISRKITGGYRIMKTTVPLFFYF